MRQGLGLEPRKDQGVRSSPLLRVYVVRERCLWRLWGLCVVCSVDHFSTQNIFFGAEGFPISFGEEAPPPPPRGCIRREGTAEAAPEAIIQAVGGGRQSGWGWLLSVTNAIEAGTCGQGDSGWA